MSSNRLINAKLDLADDLKYLVDKVPLPPTSAQADADNGNGSVSESLGSATNGVDAGSVVGVSGTNETSANGRTSSTKIDTSSIPASIDAFIHLAILGSVEDVKALVDVECMYFSL